MNLEDQQMTALRGYVSLCALPNCSNTSEGEYCLEHNREINSGLEDAEQARIKRDIDLALENGLSDEEIYQEMGAKGYDLEDLT